MNISKKTLTNYYLCITFVFLIAILFLPFGLWNYTPIYYIFFGPIVFGIAYFNFGEKLNTYVRKHHPDLMRQYSIHFGIRKGYALNPLDTLQNKTEFRKKNDVRLNRLVNLYSHCLKFLVITFLSFIVITIVGMQIQSSYH